MTNVIEFGTSFGVHLSLWVAQHSRPEPFGYGVRVSDGKVDVFRAYIYIFFFSRYI